MQSNRGNANEATSAPQSSESREQMEYGIIPESPMKNRKVTTVISGEEYIDYVLLCEIIDFGGKLSTRDIDDRVLRLAIRLLKHEVDQFRKKTGRIFIAARDVEKRHEALK
ncbi:MAG: hypothetical protein M0003_06960 [Acidithiobacillus sp.]|nr:hypothetical protein [Acidithiobacillus sp.]